MTQPDPGSEIFTIGGLRAELELEEYNKTKRDKFLQDLCDIKFLLESNNATIQLRAEELLFIIIQEYDGVPKTKEKEKKAEDSKRGY